MNDGNLSQGPSGTVVAGHRGPVQDGTDGPTISLTRPLIDALGLLATEGKARVSNRLGWDPPTLASQTVRRLAELELVHDVEGWCVRTDAGRDLCEAGLPDPPPFKYEHGTHACYVLDGCRCEPCRAARTTYEAHRVRKNLYGPGHSLTVDAHEVREHVRNLMASKPGATDGVGLKRIAKVAGVAQSTLAKLIYGVPGRGPSKRVRRETADRLFGVTRADMADCATVDSGPTRRRLSELREAGATWREIGAEVDREPTNFADLMRRRMVRVETARAVADLHRRWVAGEWRPVGRINRHTGEPINIPGTCLDCDQPSLGGGRWCYRHMMANVKQVAA